MDLNPVILAIPIFFVLMAIEILYERFSDKKTYRLNDAITNINLGTLDQVSGIFNKLFKIGIYTLVFEYAALIKLPQNWWTFFALFVLYDLCYYWSHRMAHEISLFWGGHVVHHQSEDFNLSVALRQSSTSFLWSFPFYLPLALLGFHPVQLVFVAGWNLLYQFWIHTEHIKKLPSWFETVMNTPSHHRVHHAKDSKYIDRNYAGVFIIWDKMFGTFVEESEKPIYGITKPLNSWNPVYANIAHYIDLYKLATNAKTLGDKLKILFKKPGWAPEYLGGYQEPKVIRSRPQKYDTNPASDKLKTYIFIQFLILLVVTSFFLFNFQELSINIKLWLAFWVGLSTLLLGVLFESSKKLLKIVEIIRLTALPFLAYLSGSNEWISTVVTLIMLLSILVFLYRSKI